MHRLSIVLPALLGAAACATPSQKRLQAAPPPARQVTVLYVADLHAQLDPHLERFWHDGEDRLEMAGGFARVAAAIDAIRAERKGEVLVLDAGDTFQGSAPAALTHGKAVVPALQLIGFDGAVPGNWEVAYGPEVMRARTGETGYRWFAANVRDEATGERVFDPWLLKEVAGVKIAVVGYTDPDVPLRQPPAYSVGLAYDGADELPELVRKAREEEGADVVLLASHVGLAKAVALADHVPGVDVHLSGDTHERTYEPIVKADGSWVVEPGAFGSFLGRLDLFVRDGKVVDKRWELIELTADRFPEKPEVRAAIDQSLAHLRDHLEKPVGTIATSLERYDVVETSLDTLLSDSLREATGTDIALSNGFRFGPPVAAGTVREKHLWDFFPIVTNLKTGKVSGRQLRAFWEQELENVFSADPTKRFGGWLPRPSGMTLRFRANAPKGSRIIEIQVNGEPLEDDRIYTVTACEREGDTPDMLCRMPGAQEPTVLDFDAHEAVRRYLAAHPDATATREGRVVAVDLPRVLRTQL